MRIPRSATIIIAIVTAVVWLLTQLLGLQNLAANALGFIPLRASGAEVGFPAMPVWLTPLTATLVHGGALHLAVNMLMLVWCGTKVERILGVGPLILLYVVGAYTAAIAQWLVEPGSIAHMIGASGAISAVIGAFALSFGQQKRIVSSPSLNRTLNAIWLLGTWIALQLMLTYLFKAQTKSETVDIAWAAHVGGFIAGLLMQRPLLMWRYRNA